ncbi:hypothetical protein [Serratia sp. FDAARGOS_506]|uniref:hypothetical protein n=1 Tax=Serratia sp. FDAARGOS_506 TaxID=2420306 RepID=UPI000F513996|nr:hypothetical protein [Serratia sp. FDAARGOS_506]AYZ30500.1 hypothetical protein EGY12_05025 [Serratia sp. FDAARGOS_506]
MGKAFIYTSANLDRQSIGYLGLLVFVVLSGLDSLGVELDGWKRYVMIAGVAGICYFIAGYIDKRIPRKAPPM